MCTQFKVSVLISSKANTPSINGNIYIYIYIYIKEERTYRESVFEVYFREEDMSHREDSPPPTPNENKASTSKIVTTRPNEEVVDEFGVDLREEDVSLSTISPPYSPNLLVNFDEDLFSDSDSFIEVLDENKASTSKIVTTRPNEEVVDEFKLFLEKLEKEWKEQSEKYNTTKEQQQQEMNKYDIPGDDECICNEYAQNLLCIFCLKYQ